jgi:hypothetical protein
MPGTGTATIDFGAGSTTATASVSVPEITSEEKVEAWLVPIDSTNNTADDHWIEDLAVMAGPAVEGVGFTVYAKCNTLQAHGVYNFNYVYA